MSESARPATAAILTLGCKLNIADSEAMARRLRDAGWSVADRVPEGGAEAVIVNTCSVTHVADQKSRHLVRLARRLAPNATVALTGCLLETAPREKLDPLAADLVYRQPDQQALADRIIELRPMPPLPLGEGRGEGGLPAPSAVIRPALKTRAFISAQEGCNDVCAFCIIPRTRGRERSKSVEDVVVEAQAREAEGVQEVVITGTQLGAYGRDSGVRNRLSVLLGALLSETRIARIRMSSVQPQDITPELIGLWGDSRLCRHFHLALQSGSATVLQRMRRRYTQQEYREAVARLRAAIPDVAITTDVIVGFPGETDAEFEESYAFCREIAFEGVHVFPYSQRQGTVAFKMSDQVPEPVKKQRVHRLIALADEMARAYRERFIGRTLPVLWESRRDDAWEGLTDTYTRVRARSDADMTNQLTPARLTGAYQAGLLGEVLP
ncbi:MAG TPA: tRNA (N(6)-L-threonylcarbamoyladenosine(37)-C(2))-methylthiotransferase MtaB [Dehalococcoidia bacterium]|nr:tRNA (N(6)-L-threonylcarbamoyladenosine(37)-C(2))-methylthiotransferase MtaB [Dehalococcoidia bacterium]